MKLIIRALISWMPIAAASAVAAEAGQPATVRGEATYRERIAVPPGTRLQVSLSDVSRADAPAETIGETVLTDAGQPPYRFKIDYQPNRIVASHRYSVSARLTHEGRLLFITDQTYPVITNGHPSEVRLLLKRVAESRPAGVPGSDRDAHGCISSAGYSWCARENKCVRPWELAKEKGFASTEEASRAYCSATEQQVH